MINQEVETDFDQSFSNIVVWNFLQEERFFLVIRKCTHIKNVLSYIVCCYPILVIFCFDFGLFSLQRVLPLPSVSLYFFVDEISAFLGQLTALLFEFNSIYRLYFFVFFFVTVFARCDLPKKESRFLGKIKVMRKEVKVTA